MDINGCENIVSVNVIEDVELDFVIEGILSFCEGLSMEILVEDIYEIYSWLNMVSMNGIIVFELGVYIVMVVDEFGCMGMVIIDVVVLLFFEFLIVGMFDYCIGDSIMLNGGNGYVFYQWSVVGEDE